MASPLPPVDNDVAWRPHQYESLNYSTALPNLMSQTTPSVIQEELLHYEILFCYS